MAALDRDQQRAQGHDGLARPHVALQEAMHRPPPGQIGVDLLDGSPLRSGEGERELAREGGDEPRRVPVGCHDVADTTRVTLEHVSTHDHLELQAEKLVEGQSPAGPLLLGEGLRSVDGPERLGPVHELELRTPRRGQRVIERPGPTQSLLHPLAELPAGDAGLFRGGVDRHDPARAVPDQVDHRVRELAFAPVRIELAEEQRLDPHGELLRPPRLVEERHPQVPGAVVDVELDQRAALAGPTGSHRVDMGEDERLLAHAHPRHVGLPRPVDVATWVVGDEVQHGSDVEGRQRLGPLVPDLVEFAHGDLGQPREHPPFEGAPGSTVDVLPCATHSGPRCGAHSMLMSHEGPNAVATGDEPAAQRPESARSSVEDSVDGTTTGSAYAFASTGPASVSRGSPTRSTPSTTTR